MDIKEMKLIMLVKDEALLLQMVKTLENEKGLHLKAHHTIDEVLAELPASTSDAIILEDSACGDSFSSVIDEIRKSSPSMPIVLVVNNGKQIQLEDLREAEDYILRDELFTFPLRLKYVLQRLKKWKMLYHHMQSHVDEFLSIFNCLDMGIYIVDPQNYTILTANSSAIKILGMNPVGKRCFEALLRERKEPCDHCDNELISRGIIQYGAFPWEFKCADNDRWYRCASKIISWSEKKFAKMEVIVDITDTKRMERDLNQLQVFKEKVQRLSHLAVIEFDKKGKISYTNEASTRLLGLARDEVAGQFIWRFMDDGAKEALFQLMDEVSPKNTDFIECNITGKDRKIESYLDIIFSRDIKGALIEGAMFIIEKVRHDFPRFY
jgi:PAS domain S-box-containing protein